MFEVEDQEDLFYPTEGGDNPINFQPEEEPEELELFSDSTEEKEEDPIIAFLEERGYKDGKIQVVEEDGTEKVVDFNSLTSQEKYDLLNNISAPENELSEDELRFLNYIRENKLSVNDYLANYEKEIKAPLEDATQEYNIDAYTDEELYVLDLKEKFNLTDDEIITQLELERQSPSIFKKKVDQLRAEYRDLEEQYNLTLEEERYLQAEEERKAEINKVVDVAKVIDNFHGIELDIEDKEETLSYLFDVDDKGVSNFARDINDPKKLYEAAWYLLYGKQAFNLLKEAYEKEIIALNKKKDKPSVVVNSAQREYKTIHDLD